MEVSTAYLPQGVFAPTNRGDLPVPRVFIAPQRYIQGQGVLSGIGRYLSLMEPKRAALLMSERGSRTEGVRLLQGLRSAGIDAIVRIFNGECSLEEITAHVEALVHEQIDCVIAAGGGKCIDAGKGVAFRLHTPVVVVPTLASNDAPCSALSILYSREGVSTGAEFYPNSPAFVVVDTDIIAAAPERYLVAGMGDAMATWYEARVCLQNETAVTTVGARPTLASCAIGEVCAQTLFKAGVAAAAAVAAHTVDDSLETVVEANTLLSGLGFESGGLAAAHGVAQSYTGIPKVNANYLHGEMVAMGTLAQLMMESRADEAERVAEFFATVGLPIHLGQLSLDANDKSALDVIIGGTLGFPFIGNMPQPITAEGIRSAILDAHRMGLSVTGKLGDEAYRRLHGGAAA
ncbi:MAG TPA: glycerol dehydrogenase [Thermoleophilia bacterium]|nr:glycerol dehydrogenase [Thermoleophilia bacterium]